MRGLQPARWVIGAVTLAMAASACGGSDDNAPPSGGGQAAGGGRVSTWHGEPENPLIPTTTNETQGGEVVDNLWTGLVRYRPEDAKPENAVAESITPSEGNKKFTVKIKSGWKFHDGTPVTAKSFVDAWNYGAYGPNAQKNSYFFDAIDGFAEVNPPDPDGAAGPKKAPVPAVKELKGLKVVDDTTFEVTLSSPAGSFPDRLGYSAYSPMPESFFAATDKAKWGKTPVGNGPFKFVKWDTKQLIQLTAFDGYTGADKPKIKDIDFKIYTSDDAAYQDLLANNLDIMRQLPASALAGEKWKQDLADRSIEQAQGAIQTITLPQYVPAYKNPDLGKAISMAIDRELITRTVFEKGREPATGWVAPIIPGYKPGACGEFCTYDAAKAKAALQKAGGFKGTITLGYNADASHKAWTEAVCNSIKNTLAVPCQAKPYVDFATFRKEINARKMTGMFRTGWQMDYPTIENFLGPIYATGAGSNDGDYSNPAFDAKLKEAAAAEGEASFALYQEAEAMLAEDMAVIPLWYYKTQAGYSDKVGNVKFTPFGTADFTSITVK